MEVCLSRKKNVKFKNHTAIYHSGGVNICGTIEFLTSLKVLFSKFLSCKVYKESRRVSNTWSLRFGSNKTIKIFYEYLYSNSNIYLNRKKLKFEKIINERGSTTIIGTPTRTPSHLMGSTEV